MSRERLGVDLWGVLKGVPSPSGVLKCASPDATMRHSHLREGYVCAHGDV